MTNFLAERRSASERRLHEFQEKLAHARLISDGKACVYATGSFGRGDASEYSDLDLFIVGRTHLDESSKQIRELTYLDETLLKAELIEASRELRFPDFSGDGEYLEHYTIDELVKTTGTPEDDAANTFTARLLLILESRPLIGQDVYEEVINAAIDQYWRNYKGNESEFVPAFLTNDILRLWRTFCVNYEARTSDVPEKRRYKRRLKNYKLKFSRLLTCYSALIYLLVVYRERGTVTPTDVRSLITFTPTQRLEWLLTQNLTSDANGVVERLLEMYAEFLANTNDTDENLLKVISNKDTHRGYSQQAAVFGNSIFELIQIIGQGSRLHRLLVV